METIARLVRENALAGADQERLEALKEGDSRWISSGDARIYRRSLFTRDRILYFIASNGNEKHLYLVGEKSFKPEFEGTGARVSGLHLFRADLSEGNARLLHGVFPFTAPVSLRDKTTTIGCGDRLGLATPGHVRAVSPFDCYPVLAQQSVRELALTRRTFLKVVADATFGVFQEGFVRGYGADGDHLKTIKDIDVALEARMPMITLDLTERMAAEPAAWSDAKVESEFDLLDGAVVQRVLAKYSGRTFTMADSTIVFDRIEAMRCALMYWRALDFAREVDRHLKDTRGEAYDLELSIDETTAPTLPAHHLFIASELEARGVVVSSLAPRFVGEFQKGIDYRGDLEEFERQLKTHCDVARAFGDYKISIHSGSDKFSVYPAIGRQTGMRVHLKTAGTSWLASLEVVARVNPALFRRLLAKAFDYFPDAAKLYHISAEVGRIPQAAGYPDSELERFIREPDSRQLLHITYGGLLNDPSLRGEFFSTLGQNEELHYAEVEELIGRHVALLGVPRQR